MGVPPFIIHFNRIFHYEPSSFGYLHGYGTPATIAMFDYQRESKLEVLIDGRWMSEAKSGRSYGTHPI